MTPNAVAVKKPLVTKKALVADHPTWCSGCGDFAVLAQFFKLAEQQQIHDHLVTVAGIGCSSRFPYFVNAYGAHYLHGRALTFATGLSLARPDLHVFVFGGDGDAFSIGGNHVDHAARRNVNLTYVIMDNFVYGLTKNQTSPTSPEGHKTKTDPLGNVDYPVNPMKKLIASGATFVGRAVAGNVHHVLSLMDRALKHQGFSVLEILSECTEFNRGSFDAAIPHRGGVQEMIEEKLHDGTPDDQSRHDTTDELAAYHLAMLPFPGKFGVFYEIERPTKNAHEAAWQKKAQGDQVLPDIDRLQQIFDRMK